MGATLTQRRRVRDGGLRVVNRFQQGREKTVPAEEAPANYVPAAAVIRRGRALSGFIGRKARVGGRAGGGQNRGAQPRAAPEPRGLGPAGEGGTPGVAVECADIGWNTGGEGGLWAGTDAEARKLGSEQD